MASFPVQSLFTMAEAGRMAVVCKVEILLAIITGWGYIMRPD